MEDKNETINGYIERITFRNEENGYTVAVLQTGGDEITCVGIMPGIAPGESIEAEGSYTDHPVYGRQFKALNVTPVAPRDEISLLRYLGSGAVRGVGEKLAERIIKKFGEKSLKIIEEEPERLAEVKGISLRMARDIADQMADRRDERTAFMYLQRYGLSKNLIKKLYDRYGSEVYRVISENPYRMVEEIPQVGFATADEIASKAGISIDSEYRVRSGFIYVLRRAGQRGHCYLPEKELAEELIELLGIEEDIFPALFENAMAGLAIDRLIVIRLHEEEKDIFLKAYDRAERFCALRLKELKENYEAVSDDAVIEAFLKSREEAGIKRDPLQEQAVKKCLHSGVFILSGGPGTGKTTTINTIISMLEEKGKSFVLAAPTGRAAKRMSEAAGYEAQTIHRLLEISGEPAEDNEEYRFGRNEENPLEADTVIIDEASMLDIFLFSSLLNAMLPGMQLILVGDADQLPSVGPGRVLEDLLESGAFDSIKLERIFRQDDESHIVTYAHAVNEGKHIDFTVKYPDFFLLEKDTPAVVQQYIVSLCVDVIPRKLDLKDSDIQVLTPMRKGDLGAVNMNMVLQKAMNPPAEDKEELISGSIIFREGDKVMQIRNDYELEWEIREENRISIMTGKGVFNGDVGRILRINKALRLMEVVFDENRHVWYSFDKTDELDLSYAVTIHKSQGSEYPVVILPLLSGPSMLMTRNLLYTALTRGKQCVIIVGSSRTVHEMTDNDYEGKRYTSLTERLS